MNTEVKAPRVPAVCYLSINGGRNHLRVIRTAPGVYRGVAPARLLTHPHEYGCALVETPNGRELHPLHGRKD